MRRRLLQVDWEHGIKQNFDGRERKWVIDLPLRSSSRSASRSRDLSRSASRSTELSPGFPRAELTGGELRTVFDTVVDDIGEMVTRQINSVKSTKNKLPKVSKNGPKISMWPYYEPDKLPFALIVRHVGWGIWQMQIPLHCLEGGHRSQRCSPSISGAWTVSNYLTHDPNYVHLCFLKPHLHAYNLVCGNKMDRDMSWSCDPCCQPPRSRVIHCRCSIPHCPGQLWCFSLQTVGSIRA
jgi:hypothetical protein